MQNINISQSVLPVHTSNYSHSKNNKNNYSNHIKKFLSLM